MKKKKSEKPIHEKIAITNSIEDLTDQDRLSRFKDVNELKEIAKTRRLEAKLERLKRGHGRRMSADKFLKELAKW